MTFEELYTTTGYTLTDLRCMDDAERLRLLHAWCLPRAFRAVINCAVQERAPTRWERFKSKARAAARKVKSGIQAVGRFLKHNSFRIFLIALAGVTTAVAWKPMLVVAGVAGLVALGIRIGTASVRGDDETQN